jgi:cyclopropane fatty-acyl-phospholipid synthase-like methyltransferase
MSRSEDGSAGYQEVAEEFMTLRSASRIGAGALEEWAARLPPGSAVLDLGCGHGVPVSEVLIQAGHRVYGVDASPALVAAFRARFPGVEVECARVQDSHFFGGASRGLWPGG